jgi:hypothetical protein
MVYSSGDSGYHAPATRLTPASQPSSHPIQTSVLSGSVASLAQQPESSASNPILDTCIDPVPLTGAAYFQHQQQHYHQHARHPSHPTDVYHYQQQQQQQQQPQPQQQRSQQHATASPLAHSQMQPQAPSSETHQRRSRHGSGSMFDSGEGSLSLNRRSSHTAGIDDSLSSLHHRGHSSAHHHHHRHHHHQPSSQPPRHHHHHQHQHLQQQMPTSGQPHASSVHHQSPAAGAPLDHALPRLGYLFSQNPTISASLPNYAETRALLGSHVIDSGSLDYSIEEPLSLPAGSGHHPSVASQYDGSAGHVIGAGGSRMDPAAARWSRDRSEFTATSSQQSSWMLRCQLESSATTADQLPSSSLATSNSLYRSSNPGSAMGPGRLGEHEAISRHSAMPSLDSSPSAQGPGGTGDRHRQRPIFQKSSSTPTAHGTFRRQQSMSPPRVAAVSLAQQMAARRAIGSGESIHSGSRGALHVMGPDYQTGPSLAATSEAAMPRQSRDYGVDVLPRMMEQLGRAGAEHHHQQPQHLQRRVLPQIPRPPQSPSDIQPSSQLLHHHHHHQQQQQQQHHHHHHHQQLQYHEDPEQIAHRIARQEHRRQSSLELERQEKQRLGFGGDGYDLDEYYRQEHDPSVSAGRRHHLRQHQFTTQVQQQQTPTISVSPEFQDDPQHSYVYNGESSSSAYHQPYKSSHLERNISSSNMGTYDQQERLHHLVFQPYHPQSSSTTSTHHGHRSMAMGSDSELNTRGLSSNKLYYVHVPPGRRSRHHHHHHHHHHHQKQRQQESMMSPMSSNRYMGPSLAQMSQTQPPPVEDDYATRPPPGTAASPPPVPSMVPPYKIEQHHLQRHQQQHHHHQEVYVREMSRQPVDTSGYKQTAVPLPTQPIDHHHHHHHQQLPHQQQQQQHQLQAATRYGKGVTFDGRTSAPVYGRSRQQDNYLRTASEDHDSYGDRMAGMQLGGGLSQAPGLSEADDSDNEERSSSIASHASNASYTAGDHQMQPSHTRGAITASEFNISSGRNPRESWLANEQECEEERRGSYIHHTAGQRRPSRRASRGPEFPAARHEHLSQPSRDRSAAPVSQQQQTAQPLSVSPQRLTHEPGSLSDTGAASLSDKEAAVMGTPPSRSERRARVRDQQSSNERSIGDAGGSSQSLRSQSCGQTSGGLSKKSNSTNQLSLSGKCATIEFRND